MISSKKNVQRAGLTGMTVRQSDYATYDDINALRKRIIALEEKNAITTDTNKNVNLLGVPEVTPTGTPTTEEIPGEVVAYIPEAVSAPTVNPKNGTLLFVQSGALKARGKSGTITTLAVADPHCPNCGSDFMLEWVNEAYGRLAICIACLSKELGKKPWIERDIDETKLSDYRKNRRS
jgi:hypothetical protein